MNSPIRPAQHSDVPAMVELSEQKRTQYQEYQPTFWRKADDSRERQLPFLERLINRDDVITLVYEQDGVIAGFIIADLVKAPPVYNPGGLTCRVDDFCLANEDEWETIGRELLNEVQHLAKQRGAAQTVVVCGHRDQPKRDMLSRLGFTIASEWYVREV